MDKWQQYTLRGNTEYKLKCYRDAILLHNRALDCARLQFERTAAASVERAVSQVVISHFSLADCYTALKEIDRASEFYLWAQGFLLELRGQQHSDRLLASINHALSHTDQLWREFLGKYREQIPYHRMLQYHEASRLLGQVEMRHRVCH